ncbi:MAG: O-acetyl-ADP-ribose deacetylase (regulator of RNase III) [Desulforhopalus sp.]|jgi:O-acetyl-ADP-ribose deacetylase (regulator of RNase III)
MKLQQSSRRVVKGDLIELALQGAFDVIVHGCNCFCTMGAGIARAIQIQFPEAYAADLMTNKGDRNKLGFFSSATVTENGHNITIVNGYTQFQHSGSPPLVDYDAVEGLFRKIKKEFSGKRIGYPKIGAGLAGGDWERIEHIINRELFLEDHTLVIYVP